MPTAPKGPKSQSWNVQFRVNAGDPVGREVLALLAHYNQMGYPDGHVFQEALLELGKRELPERTSLDKIAKRINDIETLISESHELIYDLVSQAMQGIDLNNFTDGRGRTLHDAVGERMSQQARGNLAGNVQGMDFDIDED